MLLSKSCEYGIRASLFLASMKRDGFVSIRTISEELGISFHFLTKIFQKLTQIGLMSSFRGPNGGIALERDAKDIKILEIILAIDGPMLFEECVLGLKDCGDEYPCPMHYKWAEERSRLIEMFKCMSLADVGEDIKTFEYRLTESPARPK